MRTLMTSARPPHRSPSTPNAHVRVPPLVLHRRLERLQPRLLLRRRGRHALNPSVALCAAGARALHRGRVRLGRRRLGARLGRLCRARLRRVGRRAAARALRVQVGPHPRQLAAQPRSVRLGVAQLGGRRLCRDAAALGVDLGVKQRAPQPRRLLGRGAQRDRALRQLLPRGVALLLQARRVQVAPHALRREVRTGVGAELLKARESIPNTWREVTAGPKPHAGHAACTPSCSRHTWKAWQRPRAPGSGAGAPHRTCCATAPCSAASAWRSCAVALASWHRSSWLAASSSTTCVRVGGRWSGMGIGCRSTPPNYT